MAEVAGLVLGVVGLAGVIGAFKDAIDLCAMVIDTRGLGRDYEVLTTKFDIERTLLLQWAQRSRLFHPSYDRRLDEPTTRSSCLRILSCIRLILDDESSLKQRYGLGKSSAVHADQSVLSISGPLMDRFFEEFEAFNLKISQKNEKTNWSAKTRWVIRDKQRFGSLVTEMAHFTTKLNELLPPVNGVVFQGAMTENDLRGMEISDLKIILEASADHSTIAQSAQKAIIFASQDRILRRLWFRTIDDRERAVASAHGTTLKWALEPPGIDFPWDDLSHWLRFESGIYWVSGKAGSGKSTLMKYLYHSLHTRSLLQQWASGPYILGNYYFWNLGTTEQKTQEGLSRTLLHQILSCHRSLIASVLPHMWQEALSTESDIALPSISETRYAFQKLAHHTPQLGKICLFIDGLDEFTGSYIVGINFLKELVNNQNVKIVVSSRPIPDCVAAFQDSPKLKLHQLTRSDIEAYVYETVGGHGYMKSLIKRFPEEALEILNDVVNKSSGVFLWVILACRSLLMGFAAYDRIAELRRRVDELPPELEQMFQHMLYKVDQRYRKSGAELLRLCYTKRQSQDTHDMSEMSSLGLALLDEEEDGLNVESLDRNNMRQLCDNLAGRLRSRCGGLLEVTPRSAVDSKCFCRPLPGHPHDLRVDGRVDFMHRTVYEFLSQEDTWDLPCLQTHSKGPDCNTSLSLLNLALARLTIATGYENDDLMEEQASKFFRDGIHWGARSDDFNPAERRNIFWRLQSFLDQLCNIREPRLPLFRQLVATHKHKSAESALSHATLSLALEAGAINFVKSHFAELSDLSGASPPTCGCFSALYHATAIPFLNGQVGRSGSSDRLGFVTKEMASLLLKNCGGDPNAEFGGSVSTLTPWEAWLKATERTLSDDRSISEIADIADMFLAAGASHHPRFFDLREWARAEFLHQRSPEVRERGNTLLRRVTETYTSWPMEPESLVVQMTGHNEVMGDMRTNSKSPDSVTGECDKSRKRKEFTEESEIWREGSKRVRDA